MQCDLLLNIVKTSLVNGRARMCVNCDLDKLHCVWLNHCFSQFMVFSIHSQGEKIDVLGNFYWCEFHLLSPKLWEIRFLTLKIGVDLYTTSTYTRVNTVIINTFSKYLSLIQLASKLTSSSSDVFSRSKFLVLTLLNTSSRASQFFRSSLTPKEHKIIGWEVNITINNGYRKGKQREKFRSYQITSQIYDINSLSKTFTCLERKNDVLGTYLWR